MEYRIKDYTIKGQRILLPRQTSIEDLRLIYNETQKKLICSTATKDNVTLVQGEGGTLVEVPASVCVLNSTDLLTIKCDYGDNLEEVKEAVEDIDLSSIESKVETEADSIKAKIDESVNTLSTKIDNIDLSAVENKVDEVKQAVENIKLPELDTTELAKQGENQEATNSKIYEEIQKIASVDSDILQGKRRIASSITLKGIDADYKESLNDLAKKINQIPQKQYISIGDDKYYYPQPYMQSIFAVAEDLKKSDMPDYIPAYMKEYKDMFGVNQFVVVDYYQDTIVADNADGILTSDGHFYTKSLNTVTHTFPSGETEKYDSGVIKHTFSNTGYINNWCAYFFIKESYDFGAINANGIMNILVCGTCGSLDVTMLSNVYIDGYVESIKSVSESSLGDAVIVNYISHKNGEAILKKDLYCRVLKILDLETIENGSTIVNYMDVAYVNGKSNTMPPAGRLTCLFCPSLKRIKGGSSIFTSEYFTDSYSNSIGVKLKEISFEELETIDSTSYIYKGHDERLYARQTAFRGVERIHLPKLKECSTLFKSWYTQQKDIFNWFSNVKSIELPSLLNVPSTMFSSPIQSVLEENGNYTNYSRIELLDYSSAKTIGTNLGGICASHTTLTNLIDLRVGALEGNVNAQYWTATNVIADETKKAQLQQNIHNHIAERVSDRTGMSALTFTFSQAVRNILLTETEDLFKAKNWNIAPTRTS